MRPPCLGQWGQTVDQQTTNKPENQQKQRTNRPTSQQIDQKSIKNPPKNHAKSIKNQLKFGSWGLLGGSGAQELKSQVGTTNVDHKGHVLALQVKPKIHQSPEKSVPRAIQKVIIFLIECVVGFWCHLVPTWVQLGRQNHLKIDPSWSQNPEKKGSRCWPNFCFIFHRSGNALLSIFPRSWKAEGAKSIEKLCSFIWFLLLQPTCQQEAIKSIFESTWLSTWHPKPAKNRAKRLPRSIKKNWKLDASWLGIWTPLGTDFGRFWCQVGRQVGPKLAPKSGKIWKNGVLKNHAKNDLQKSMQLIAGGTSGPPCGFP